MTEHNLSSASTFAELQLLDEMQARLEQRTFDGLFMMTMPDMQTHILKRLEDLRPYGWAASYRLKQLLQRLHDRALEEQQSAQLEQLVHAEELPELVQLVRIAWRAWSSREALALLRRVEQLAVDTGQSTLLMPPEEFGQFGSDYDTDFYAWTQKQAALLEGGQFDVLDIPHLVEEILSLGKSEQRELVNRLSPLLEHLLKLTIAAERLPHDFQRAERLWRMTVKTQRVKVAQVLRDNPSLRPTVPQAVTDAYAVARLEAAAGLNIDDGTLPLECPWTPEQVLDNDFWPEL